MMIDTLRLARRLMQDAKMDQRTAETLADALNAELRESAVTKQDLSEATSRLETVIANSRNQIVLWVAALLVGAVGLNHLWK